MPWLNIEMKESLILLSRLIKLGTLRNLLQQILLQQQIFQCVPVFNMSHATFNFQKLHATVFWFRALLYFLQLVAADLFSPANQIA